MTYIKYGIAHYLCLIFCVIAASGVKSSVAERKVATAINRTQKETTMENVVNLVKELMVEYAQFVNAPFPATWDGTAFEDDPEAAGKFEAEHPAYFLAWRWFKEQSG